MRRRLRSRVGRLALLALAALGLDFPPLADSPGMFRRHREALLARMGPNTVAIFHAAPPRIMSNDVPYLYRQDSNFYYLTGLEEAETVAVLRSSPSDGKRFLLFVRREDPLREAFEGRGTTPAEAVSRHGADAAFPVDEFWTRMGRYDAATRSFSGFLGQAERVLLFDGGDSAWGGELRKVLEPMRSREPALHAVLDARPLVHELRVVKDADEIARIRRAAEITSRGHLRAMRAAQPGTYEFEVQEALDGYCYANGARRMAYPSVVASGPNSVVLHWGRNDRQLSAGDVLLNDSGAEYAYYAADITRTYPVGGRFRPAQRAVYEVVLAAQKAALARVGPGVLPEEIEKAASRVQTEGLLRLGLLAGDPEKLLREDAHRRFTKHAVSHGVGLDVHDVGRYTARRLEPGMVITIEPGIYISAGSEGVDPKWWNIGVRIEDMVVVTSGGFDCLSCTVPKEPEEVERTVQSGKK